MAQLQGVHVITTSEETTALVDSLSQNLPSGLPLIRRLQSQPRTPHTLLLCTFKPGTRAIPPYAVTIIDRTSPDLHQVSLHSSVELHDQPFSDIELRQICSLLAYFHEARPAAGVETLWDQVFRAASNIIPSASEDIVFGGCVHSRVASLLRAHPRLQELGIRIARDEILGPGGPYRKLVFRTPQTCNHEDMPPAFRVSGLPHGLKWDTVRTDADIDAVMSTNNLVRVRAQLDARTNVAVRKGEEGEIVGWSYLGIDGSVKTLYVLPEWRGKGLAKMMIKKLVEKGGWSDGWCHADATPDNTESNALFTACGAKPWQESYWMKIDAAAAARVVNKAEAKAGKEDV